MADSNKTMRSYKVVLVGISCVGKTSVVNRYVNNKFTSDTKCTAMGCFFKKEVNLKPDNVNIMLNVSNFHIILSIDLGHSWTRAI